MYKIIIAVLMMCFAVAVHANPGRNLPANVKSGELQALNFPLAKIDGKVYRISPGVRIFDQANQIVPYSYVRQASGVYYQLDPRGELTQIWLLTPQESQKIKKPSTWENQTDG